MKYYGPYEFAEQQNFTVIPSVTTAHVIDMRAIQYKQSFTDICDVKTLDITDPSSNNIFFHVVLYRGQIESAIITNGEIYFPISNPANASSLTLRDKHLIMCAIKETLSELF